MSTSQIPILPPSTEANQNPITIEQSPEVSPRRSLRRHKPNINYKDFGDESDANESEEFDINEEHKNHMSKKRNRSRNACKKICNKMNKNINNSQFNDDEDIYKRSDENAEGNIVEKDIYGEIINIQNLYEKYSTELQNIPLNQGAKNPHQKPEIPCPFKNSDIILFIYEICLNSNKYNLKEENNSRKFWNQLNEIELFNKILYFYKSETLRKYWRILNNAGKFKRALTLIRLHIDSINNNNIKLLSCINVISEVLIKKQYNNLGQYLSEISGNSNDINENKDIKINESTQFYTEKDKLNEIYNVFKKHFWGKKDPKKVFEALYINNFDVKNAYLTLKDRENIGNVLGFNQDDDELILKQNKNETEMEEYNTLINKKGYINVLKRKFFLEN